MKKKIVFILLVVVSLCVQGAVSRHRYEKIQKRIVIKRGKPRIIKGKLADTIWKLFQSKQSIIQSSSLHPEKYNARKIFDRNFSTCWAEGSKGFGQGEWVIFRSIAVFWLYNGMWRSKALFYANNRVRKMKISFYRVYARDYSTHNPITMKFDTTRTVFTNVYLISETVVKLPDGMYPIEIDKVSEPIPFEISPDNKNLPFEKWANTSNLFCRLEILDVYRGSKYNDTCISEIVGGRFNALLPGRDKFVY